MVDANVLIAGTVWPRWSNEVLQHARRGDFQIVLSPLVIRQARHRVATRFPNYINDLDTALQAISPKIVSDPTAAQVTRNATLSRDVTDVPIALAAIKAKAYCLISEDKDLTVQDETTAQLRQQLKIMTSGKFLREVMGWTSEELERVRGRLWHDLPAPQTA